MRRKRIGAKSIKSNYINMCKQIVFIKFTVSRTDWQKRGKL